MNEKRHVVVIGAGILGAAIAWHLARGGARVTVVEAEREPGGLATRASFAWINAGVGKSQSHVGLRLAAIAGWHRLAREVPGIAARFTGGLAWNLPRAELEANCAEHARWGGRIRLVERDEIARIEPRLIDPPEVAAFAEDEGMVEAPGAARALIAGSSADLRSLETVNRLLVENGRVTGVVGEGELAADAVVVAAGIAAQGLLATAGIDFAVDSTPGLLVYTAPHERLIERLLVTPMLDVRQGADGRLHAGADFTGSFDLTRPEDTMMALMAALRGLLKGAERLRPEGFTIGERPAPADGLPALGAVPGIAGLYVAVTRSGVTLAPAIGAMLAREILDHEIDPLVAPYRVSRFMTG